MVQICFDKITDYFRRAMNSPFGLQSFILAVLIFFVAGFRPPYFLFGGERFDGDFFGEKVNIYSISEVGFLDNFSGIDTAGMREILVEDENGDLVIKVKPRKRDKAIAYIVKSGDNISKIAHKFGLNISTILWANDLTSKQTLAVGKKLQIPPTDGVFYTVRQTDTLGEIAKTHNIEIEKIYAYNKIKADKISIGQKIFLPDAKKIFVSQKIIKSTQDSNQSSSIVESIGFRIRRPTRGVLTQGFHKKHYAIDIANKLNTPIYSGAGGKVIKSDDGWNYGYGNYIVIDHGNGVETLYAHLNIRKVFVDDEVKTGQLIGLMGNTGNVWGPTGIHLHFELRIRGRKVNPNNYFAN
jgi:murein DD-endopeptidase MepM/ murein hydrolase activator NlpD